MCDLHGFVVSLCVYVCAVIRTHEEDGQEQALFDKETSEAVVAGTHFQVVRLTRCASCVEQWAILGKGMNTEALEVEVCVCVRVRVCMHACMHV